MPLPSEGFYCCCQCGAGPYISKIYLACIECSHQVCRNCNGAPVFPWDQESPFTRGNASLQNILTDYQIERTQHDSTGSHIQEMMRDFGHDVGEPTICPESLSANRTVLPSTLTELHPGKTAGASDSLPVEKTISESSKRGPYSEGTVGGNAESTFSQDMEHLTLSYEETAEGGPTPVFEVDYKGEGSDTVEELIKKFKHEREVSRLSIKKGEVRNLRPAQLRIRKQRRAETSPLDDAHLPSWSLGVSLPEPNPALRASTPDYDSAIEPDQDPEFVDLVHPIDNFRSSSTTPVDNSSSDDGHIDSFQESSATESEIHCSDGNASEASSQTFAYDDLKEEIIDHLMGCFCVWWYGLLRHMLPENQRVTASGSNGQTSSSGSTRTTHTPSHSETTNTSGAAIRKGGRNSGECSSGRDDQDDEDDQDDQGDRRPSKRQRKRKSEVTESKRLACPFYKRNPRKYRHHKQCPGPGWNNVARLKTEHLYKAHMLHQCLRCGKEFESDGLLESHFRSLEACPRKDKFMRGDGIDVKQKERLKDRKGIKLKGRKLSEKERWIEVFKILFKDHDPERIPSPYYDSIIEDDAQSLAFDQLDLYLRNDIPVIVRQILTDRLGQVLDHGVQQLRDDFLSIVESLRLWVHDARGGFFDPTSFELPSLPALQFTSSAENPTDAAFNEAFDGTEDYVNTSADFDQELVPETFEATRRIQQGMESPLPSCLDRDPELSNVWNEAQPERQDAWVSSPEFGRTQANRTHHATAPNEATGSGNLTGEWTNLDTLALDNGLDRLMLQMPMALPFNLEVARESEEEILLDTTMESWLAVTNPHRPSLPSLRPDGTGMTHQLGNELEPGGGPTKDGSLPSPGEENEHRRQC